MLIEGLSWCRIRRAVRRCTCGPLDALYFCHLSSLVIERSSSRLHLRESNAFVQAVKVGGVGLRTIIGNVEAFVIIFMMVVNTFTYM